MSWRIESATTRHGKWVEWTITKGVNSHGDGPEATVCTVTSSREDAALIAAAPEMYAMLEDIAVSMECFHGVDTDAIYELLAKARGEQ